MCLLLSHVQLFATAWTVAHKAPFSMEFSRKEYWRGLPFPSLGDLPDLGIEPRLLHCRQIYQLSYKGSLFKLQWQTVFGLQLHPKWNHPWLLPPAAVHKGTPHSHTVTGVRWGDTGGMVTDDLQGGVESRVGQREMLNWLSSRRDFSRSWKASMAF